MVFTLTVPLFLSFDSTKTTDRVVSGDFNGDGKDDIAAMYDCGYAEIKIYVWLSNGTTYDSPVVWYDSGPGEYNASSSTAKIASGDFDHNGKDDIAAFYDYGNSYTQILVFESITNDNKFTSYQLWYNNSAFDCSKVTGRVVGGDFNNDGYDDIAAMYDCGSAQTKIYVWVSNGYGFNSPTSPWYDSGPGEYNASSSTRKIASGDFDGNGRDDIAAFYDYGNNLTQIFVFNSTGNNTFTSYQLWYNDSAYDCSKVTGRVVGGDFNNDGKDDIAAIYDYGNNNIKIHTFISDGTSSFAINHHWYDSNSYNASQVAYRMVAGDCNGDGTDEVFGINNYGSNMSQVVKWTSGNSNIMWDSSKNTPTTTNQTTTLLSSITNNGVPTSYTYDDRGNILTISENSVLKASYTYDLLNQLTSENNAYTSKSIDYFYDAGGNITHRDEYNYTNGTRGSLINSYAYSYDSTWKDELTSYDGKTITYDEIGNPLSFDGRTFTWDSGRQLASTTKDGYTASYTYNDSGIRTSKTANGVTTTYYLNGDNVAREENKTGETTNYSIDYYYDANNDLFGFKLNGTDEAGEYYYVRNGQNDIIGILDSTGTQVVTYTYDSWGKLQPTTGTMATTVGEKNPYRYRGYRYDNDTGLYCTATRYYDPVVGRFINADAAIGQIGNVQGHNMFAYAFNNPVMYSDPTGNWPSLSQIFTAVAVVAAVVAVAAVVTAAVVVTCGAAAPALAAAGVGVMGGMSAGAVAATAATALAVAGTAAKVAAVATAAAVVTSKAEKPNNSVYVLKDDEGTVQYVGRTTNVDNRRKAHEANPARAGLRMEVIQPNLNLVQARAVEQAAMAYYHTINTANKMNNQINGIAPSKWGAFKEAAVGMLGYGWNQVSNEILYWTGN